MSRYGPPSDDDHAVTVVVGTCRCGTARTPEVTVPAHPGIVLQRRQLADLACYGYVTTENSGSPTREPLCRTCGRAERDCLSARPGSDDHPFELTTVTAQRPPPELATT